MPITYYPLRIKEKKTSIMMSCCFKTIKFKITTGEVIQSINWDDKKKQVKGSEPSRIEINKRLTEYKFKVESYIDELKKNAVLITDTELKAYIKSILKPKYPIIRTPKDISLIQYFQEMIDLRKKGIERIKKTGKPYGNEIIKSYQTTLNHLVKYEKSLKQSLSFKTLDEDFYSAFTHHLSTKEVLNNNTIGGIIKNIKTFMNRSRQKGLTKNTAYKDFISYKEETNAVALDESELQKIISLDLADNSRLEKTRDMFIIQCNTGLRFSDLINLKPENIDLNSGYIRIETIKTEQRLEIPILPDCLNVLVKYPDKQLPVLSSQKYNEYIKELCKLAGIIESEQVIQKSGAVKKYIAVPKYELISSHTARRTFATVALLRGIPVPVVMKITGHKQLSNFQLYVRLAEKQAAKLFKEQWEGNKNTRG